MSGTDDTLKAQIENDYSRDDPDVMEGDYLPTTTPEC